MDRDETKAKFTSGADWKDGQSSKAPQNGFGKQDSFKVKQKDLSSTVFEQTDYQEYLPLSKANSEAILEKKFKH